MDQYSFLRALADSWVLLALFTFFVGAVIWVFRPGSGGTHREASEIPFRNDRRPAAAAEDKEIRS
jgi:cytochrome c oxidase cbb3-type subunit 4